MFLLLDLYDLSISHWSILDLPHGILTVDQDYSYALTVQLISAGPVYYELNVQTDAPFVKMFLSLDEILDEHDVKLEVPWIKENAPETLVDNDFI